MRTRIFSARALAFRPFDERFIKDLIRKRSRAEGQWKSQCHFLPSFRVKIGRPYLQPFLSCFGGRILRGSSRDRNRVHYLAGSSESFKAAGSGFFSNTSGRSACTDRLASRKPSRASSAARSRWSEALTFLL